MGYRGIRGIGAGRRCQGPAEGVRSAFGAVREWRAEEPSEV